MRSSSSRHLAVCCRSKTRPARLCQAAVAFKIPELLPFNDTLQCLMPTHSGQMTLLETGQSVKSGCANLRSDYRLTELDSLHRQPPAGQFFLVNSKTTSGVSANP